jgi:uncharacterized protein
MGKRKTFMIFFIVVISVNLIVNLYIFFRTKGVFPENTSAWWITTVIFWMLAFAYVIGRFTERSGSEAIAEGFIKAGSIWLGAMVYLTILFLVTDILRGLNSLFHFSDYLRFNWHDSKGKGAILLVYGLTSVILLIGFINTRYPVVKKVYVSFEKKVPEGSLRVVLASDLHLGIMNSTNSLKKMVSLINSQNADLILLGGDVFDEDLGPVIRNNLGDLLKNLKARHGVYAVLGNHEFYGNATEAQKYLKDHNIVVLRDSLVVLDNGITIIGREDLTAQSMYGRKRKSLSQLLDGVNISNPLLMLDHQPYHVAEVAESPIDLQVSGHTHNGQMWPFNYITNAIFDIGEGYRKINRTHFYVSSGYGTWGPPIRTNSRSEIIVLEISGS